jgi:hypothetical protein
MNIVLKSYYSGIKSESYDDLLMINFTETIKENDKILTIKNYSGLVTYDVINYPLTIHDILRVKSFWITIKDNLGRDQLRTINLEKSLIEKIFKSIKVEVNHIAKMNSK